MTAPVDHAADLALLAPTGGARRDGLAELYRRHGGAVFGLARRMLRDQMLAEEVTQEVFLRLWRAPERYDPARGSLRTFLLTHTRGAAIDVLRSETSRRRRENRGVTSVPPDTPDPGDDVWAAMSADHLHGALDVLSDDQRRAIELAYFRGHSYREVAEILGEAEGTIKSRMRAGLHRMRDHLEDSGLVSS